MSRKFNKKIFIRDVFNDKYALVIGNEFILDAQIEPTGDVHQFFLNKVNNASHVQYERYHEIAVDKSEKINPIRKVVEGGDVKFFADAVSLPLRRLLETKLFTTVLTTTTDGFLEAALRDIWGEKLRVVNIYDKDTVDDFQRAKPTGQRNKRYTQPTLIYVFGRLDEDDLQKKYLRTDADAILLIEKWMKMDAESDNEMIRFIREKRLLALGCKFDNWYFRFFWYVLTGVNDSSNSDYDGKGEVAFLINENDKSEIKLQQFLNRTDICILGDANSFVTDMVKLLTEESEDAPFRQLIEGARSRSGIFISYCSKDALTACQLFYQLCEKKYKVWLDNARLYGGDNYEEEIADAISSSKFFIALLSPHISADLVKGNVGHYYNKEWRMARQFGDKTIIPLAVNGYNWRTDYHKTFEEIIGTHIHAIDLMDADGFAKLIASINEHL